LNEKYLIVDDEPLNLDLLEALLIPEGYALERAGAFMKPLKKYPSWNRTLYFLI
jgi:CheY-like chemotaxis protein